MTKMRRDLVKMPEFRVFFPKTGRIFGVLRGQTRLILPNWGEIGRKWAGYCMGSAKHCVYDLREMGRRYSPLLGVTPAKGNHIIVDVMETTRIRVASKIRLWRFRASSRANIVAISQTIIL